MAVHALLADDPLFSEHRAPSPHPERPERLAAARRAAQRAGATVNWIATASRDATADELARVHHAEYVESLGQLAGHWTSLDADTYVCPESIAAARRAAGTAVSLVDDLLAERARWGVALLRPPGHHARPSQGMGFCLLNNVAVAAAHARALGVPRVIILDWDVNHGNGTQEMFYGDAEVLYISMHQFPYYPGTGAVSDVGAGAGVGYTVNVPLSAGAADDVYAAVFDRIVCPIVEQYRPGLALVSAGFDAHRRDPLGGMALSDAGYGAIAAAFRASLPESTPLGLLLEGGYDLSGLEGGLMATMNALTDGHPRDERPTAALGGEHGRELEQALAMHRRHWVLD